VGQKTNPKGFRLITTQTHLSNWYTQKKNYPVLIEEDYFVREKIQKAFENILTISEISIQRITQETVSNEYAIVTVHALFPRAKEMYKKLSKLFDEKRETEIQKKLGNSKPSLKIFTGFLLKQTIRKLIRLFQLKTGKKYYIGVKFLKNQFENATLIAKYIASQLEKRVPFRRAVKQTIKKVQLTSIKGIKIEVSGRLNGVEIARSEWKRDGKIPLHTLKATMDYTHQIAETIYGVIGIKVWLFIK
jgi:small subunit ribosomal protein S3